MTQRTVIEKYITQKFKTPIEHLWTKSPDYGVYRVTKNKKWFAVIMVVDRAKMQLSGDGMVDILNLKCAPEIMGDFLQSAGYRPAYHMSKAHWISVVLDNTVNTTEIKQLIDLSYNLVAQK